MIDLRAHYQPIVHWLVEGLARFAAEHPEVRARHVALYCCPWSGWISLCIDSTLQLDQNCPDFEFVEYALYEAPEWAAQYESQEELVIIEAGGSRVAIAGGDEALNHAFFAFLRDLLSAPTTLDAIAGVQPLPERLGVQLLDSGHARAWTPRRS